LLRIFFKIHVTSNIHGIWFVHALHFPTLHLSNIEHNNPEKSKSPSSDTTIKVKTTSSGLLLIFGIDTKLFYIFQYIYSSPHINERMIFINRKSLSMDSSPGIQPQKALRGPAAKKVFSYKRRTLRWLTALETGHGGFTFNLSKMRVVEEDICRFCMEQAETVAHVVCSCSGIG